MQREMLPMDYQIAERLRILRKIKNVSQDALASGLGITWQQVQKYEKGINRIYCGRLHKISTILNVNVSYFFETEEINEESVNRQTPHKRIIYLSEKTEKKLVEAAKRNRLPPDYELLRRVDASFIHDADTIIVPKEIEKLTFITIKIGRRLSRLLMEKKWTKDNLAVEMGTSEGMILKYCRGEQKMSAARLYQICQIFNISPNYFFDKE